MFLLKTHRFGYHMQCRAGLLNEDRWYMDSVRLSGHRTASLACLDSEFWYFHGPSSHKRVRRKRMQTVCALETGSNSGEDSRRPFSLGTTRLQRIIQGASKTFLGKFNSGRNKFPLKIFFLLLGYYSSNALATVIGQTGDWDVLAAGFLVALIEFIGHLMYRMPAFLGERGKEGVVFMNFFKAGFSFGLFVDAFKLGS